MCYIYKSNYILLTKKILKIKQQHLFLNKEFIIKFIQIQQQNINNMLDQQNIGFYTVQSLDLNFKKNKTRKQGLKKPSKTDRKNNQTNFQEELKSQRNVLIQKKKNYSDAIRERNLNLLSKKKLDHENHFQSQYSSKEQYLQKQSIQSPRMKVKSNSQIFKKKDSSALKLNQNNKQNKHISILDFQAIPFTVQNQTYLTVNQQFNPRDSRKKQFKEEIDKNKQQKQQVLKKSRNNLDFCSNIYHQKIVILDSDATILMKQNATFKRDLANFRKQNSVLKKQLKVAQSTQKIYLDHIQQLQEKTKNILQGSFTSFRPSQQLIECEEMFNKNFDNNIEIIQKLREQIQELRNVNSGLELRAYMAEKKVVQQVSMCKKKMAKQLHQWRDKCSKLRAENMKYKCFRDMTISMQISKDQNE